MQGEAYRDKMCDGKTPRSVSSEELLLDFRKI